MIMFIKIELNSDTPIYMQIYDEIVKAIASGDLKEGTVLPSARKLAANLGINFHTVNKAYNLLREHGFLLLNRKKEFVVQRSRDEKFMEKLMDQELKLFEEAIAKGFTEKEILNMLQNVLKRQKKSEEL
ncbi:MAG: GntR family transcriptional regulator [Thermoplasmata archaeon]|nr:GntR family transcriptional regulator [Thermoplasmata archaeon]